MRKNQPGTCMASFSEDAICIEIFSMRIAPLTGCLKYAFSDSRFFGKWLYRKYDNQGEKGIR